MDSKQNKPKAEEAKNKEEKEQNEKQQKEKEKIEEEKEKKEDKKNENKKDEKNSNEGKDNKEEESQPIKSKSITEMEKLINYKYNEKEELVNKQTGEKCGRLNKQEYELVGMYVQKYVENLLISKFDLTTLYIPNKNKSIKNFMNRDESQAQCKIVITKDFETNPKCLMLIQGTGVVRLGQWARSVCINENLILGTMMPYVHKAIKNNFSVIIFNPNERFDFINEKKKIEEFKTMESHSLYVYENIVKTNKNIKEIYIVAHSRGGDCAVEILLKNEKDLLSGKIKRIAFTDSVHGDEYLNLSQKGINKFREISRNYVTSDKPLGTFVKSYEDSFGGVDCYSSGHRQHEYTSGTAIEEIFDFFEKNKEKKQLPKEDNLNNK